MVIFDMMLRLLFFGGLVVAAVAGAAGPASAQTVINPSPMVDFFNQAGSCEGAFEGLKGNPVSDCTPARIEEWAVANAQPSTSTTTATRQRITKWETNQVGETVAVQCTNAACTWASGVAKSFTFSYDRDTHQFGFTLGGNTQTAILNPANRALPIPLLNQLYFRVASPSGRNCGTAPNPACDTYRMELSDLALTSQGVTTAIGDILSTTTASNSRQVKYAVVHGLPDADWVVTGTATAFGANLSGSSWQVKTAYQQPPEAVPAPLPVVGGLMALGWSRKLRRRISKQAAT